jgi:hypothetical protein
MADDRSGKPWAMAKNDDLFTTLRQRGLRKSVAQAISDAQRGGKRKRGGKAEALARDILKDLGKARDTIRTNVLDGGVSPRSAAGKKAAATRKRNAAKRSAAARKSAVTRARRAKAGSR